MKKKRVRFGIKFVDGKFYELISLRPHKKSYIMWTHGTEKHITTIVENDTISSHVTHQKEGWRKPLGRFSTESEIDEDEFFAELTNLRKLEKSEYDKVVYYKNEEFFDIMNITKLEMITKEKEDEILKYIDFTHYFDNIQERLEIIRRNKIWALLPCKASDLLVRKDIEGALAENLLVVMEHEGELWEFDPTNLYRLDKEDNPLSEWLKPFGIFELAKDIDFTQIGP